MKKKNLFFMLFLVLGFGKSFAGNLTIVNLTSCVFNFYSGLGSVTYNTSPTFTFGPFNAGPGTTSYSALNLPGFSYQGSGYTGVMCVDAVKVQGPDFADFAIGKTGLANTSYSSYNWPACNGGNNYTMSWSTSGNNCEVVILVY